MEKIKKAIKIIRNKYVLSALIFLVWISFFDSHSLLKSFETGKKLKKLRNDRDYLRNEIINDSTKLLQLRSGPENLEKFAREKYLMKADSEDIYIVVKEKSVKKNR